MRSLLQALFLHGQITTTKAKAKVVAVLADKMMTLAKKGNLASRRQAHKFLTKRELVNLLFNEISPRFKDYRSGFTRLISLGPRKGDDAPMVRLELISKPKTDSSAGQ